MMWLLAFTVSFAGGIGGVVNALLSDNGFLMPRKEQVDQATIVRPGFLANVLIGAIAAVISWGLYGPFAMVPLIGELPSSEDQPLANLTLSGICGAILVGIAGARWLTNEVDKTLLKVAASKAAGAKSNSNAAQQMALVSPASALSIAMKMESNGTDKNGGTAK